jgi:NitT/TauT family transport system substrate-binding protein
MSFVRTTSLLAAAFVCAFFATPIQAGEALRVGKAVPESFAFVPLDIGMHEGIYKQNGIGIDEIAFAGDAKLQQAMAADSLDIALGSGPAMAFIAKGAPTRAIAAMGGPPLDLTIVVRPDGPKTAAELKGKKVSVSTVGGLTYWLVSETSRQQRLGTERYRYRANGQHAAADRGVGAGRYRRRSHRHIDGAGARKLGKARILTRFGQIVKDFHVHIIYATDKVIANRPDAIRGFLKGWFESIAFMRNHKSESVTIATQVIGKDDSINSETYDELMPMFSNDGRFDQKALDTLAKSYVELKVLPAEPDMTKLYTEAFLPK